VGDDREVTNVGGIHGVGQTLILTGEPEIKSDQEKFGLGSFHE